MGLKMLDTQFPAQHEVSENSQQKVGKSESAGLTLY
jgi:hypothetical protein